MQAQQNKLCFVGGQELLSVYCVLVEKKIWFQVKIFIF